MFDVIIIGAGVNGAFVAYRLAKYQLKVLVIDKESDVCNETSVANSLSFILDMILIQAH